MDCLFCKIIEGEIPATIIYQDEQVIVINDINPQAPQHKLIIPRQHISTLNDLTRETAHLLGQMAYTAQNIAKKCGIAEKGYRTVVNCNAAAGQTVFHIHMHLLGGRTMSWPPG